jgi:hypothetical protein
MYKSDQKEVTMEIEINQGFILPELNNSEKDMLAILAGAVWKSYKQGCPLRLSTAKVVEDGMHKPFQIQWTGGYMEQSTMRQVRAQEEAAIRLVTHAEDAVQSLWCGRGTAHHLIAMLEKFKHDPVAGRFWLLACAVHPDISLELTQDLFSWQSIMDRCIRQLYGIPERTYLIEEENKQFETTLISAMMQSPFSTFGGLTNDCSI